MITITKKPDSLTQEKWEFTDIDNTLYLNSYTLGTRESTRHRKYHVKLSYSRIMHRSANIDEKDVPFPDSIRNEALQQFVSKIKCLKWSERKK